MTLTRPQRPLATSNQQLATTLLSLALPVVAEQFLNLLVGLNDTYLANHLPEKAPGATAAVGSITYFIWFIHLTLASIGTGATAIIARAIGARHRSLANAVCGQSIAAAFVLGIVLGALMLLFTDQMIYFAGLKGDAVGFARLYVRMLAFAMPFSTALLVANSCLRGAGDTMTPAISMAIVDAVNIFFTFSLARGWWFFPRMGFSGIATGTVIAYLTGGTLQVCVLLAGRGGIRLYAHRLAPHWHTLKRIMRVGIPAGAEGVLNWAAQFSVIAIINSMDATNRISAAHINAVQIEGISYMVGIALATAAATMVGQSLGRGDPQRARRSAFLAFLFGGGFMTLCGICFILLGQHPAHWMSPNNAAIADLTRKCLFITGWIQCGFAASVVFGGALRGAGDTLAVMLLNLASVITIRVVGVVVVVYGLHLGLVAIWIVLSCDLFVRGALLFMRFTKGHWRHIQV